jgi:chitinase
VKLLLAVLLLVAVSIPASVTRSGATFVASTANPGATFNSAADFNTVSVSLLDPGSPLRGTVSLSATAASDRGIASVRFQSAPAGSGSWSDICTDAVAPYTCSFDTTTVGDGQHDVRALATDTAGYSRSDVVVDRSIDNTAPAATTVDPGSPLTGDVTVEGSASDSGSGLASITLQYRATSGTWTDICTQSTSPVACTWNTGPLADGLYDLRTVAVDGAGNSGTSSPVYNRRVDNTAPSATLTPPAALLRGTITLDSTTADGAGSGVQSVRYEYKLSSAGSWSTACTSSSSPFSCTFNTASVADGLYDFRAVAIDGVALTGTSAAVTSRRIDNTGPTAVTLAPVASPLQNTVALTGTATDTGSGMASLQFQYAPAGTGSWTDICTDTAAPYTCSFNTTTVADGLYDLRTLATDQAGNTTASATQTNLRIDNTGPAVAITSPAAGPVRGTITISGTATDGVGVSTTTFQYRQGAGAWQTICTDVTAPYSCPGFDTAGLADGTYELRMQATDTLTHTSTSATVTIQIDNTAPTAADVQAANGGTLGTIDGGDTITFTWSEPMSPASIMTGWDGSSQAVQVRVQNAGANDRLEVRDSGGTTLNLTAGQHLQLNADYVSATAVYDATIVRSGSTVTVTLGTLVSGTPRTGVTTAAAMVWNSSTAATDLAGNAATGNVRAETGAADQDF